MVQHKSKGVRADGITILDAQWRYVFINDAAALLLPRPRAEVIGKSAWDIFPGIIGSAAERDLRKAVESSTPTTRECSGSANLGHFTTDT